MQVLPIHCKNLQIKEHTRHTQEPLAAIDSKAPRRCRS